MGKDKLIELMRAKVVLETKMLQLRNQISLANMKAKGINFKQGGITSNVKPRDIHDREEIIKKQ